MLGCCAEPSEAIVATMSERGMVIHTFEAEMSDELTVRPGEQVFSSRSNVLIPHAPQHGSTCFPVHSLAARGGLFTRLC